MIEDKELRDLFKAESEEHLQNLDKGLLRLEKNPNDSATLEEVFREVHSLKGSARMLGVKDVELICHGVENMLGKVRKGETTLSSDMTDRIYRALDAVRKLVHEAVSGELAGVEVTNILQTISECGMGSADVKDKKAVVEDSSSIKERAISTQQKAKTKKSKTKKSEIRIPNSEIATPEIPAPASEIEESKFQIPNSKIETPQSEISTQKSKIEEYRIDTIRVETRKLDGLMTHAGELTVMKTRMARRLAQMEEAIEMWETVTKDAVSAGGGMKSADSIADSGLRSAELKQKCGGDQSVISTQKSEIQQERIDRLGAVLGSLRDTMYEDNSRFEFISHELDEGIRNVRLLPFSTIFNLFPRMVRDMAHERSKEAELELEGGETGADKHILEEMKDPLMHMARNAIDHGIETPDERERAGKPRTGTIRIKAYRTDTNIIVEVTDDGRGLDLEAIKRTAIKRKIYSEADTAKLTAAEIQSLIFVSGFSTSSFITDISGRGVGLDVVRTNVDRLKGTVHVESTPGAGCTVRVKLPITLATARVLIVLSGGRSYAIPVEFVQTMRLISPQDIFLIEGRETITIDEQPVSVTRLSDILEMATPQSKIRTPQSNIPCVILFIGEEKLGILVDALLDEQEVVLKHHSALLRRVRNVSGAAILGSGEVCMVLNPQDMMKTLQRRTLTISPEIKAVKEEKKQAILLVEDSITTRTQEKRILEGSGYEVVTAVDGVDALNKLAMRPFDAVVTDIMMPNMDGLTLTAKIRQDKKYRELPVILVTTLASDEDKKRGLDASANAYIPKPSFDQKILLETLKRLI